MTNRFRVLLRWLAEFAQRPERLIAAYALIPFGALLVYVYNRAQIVPWFDEWTSSAVIVRKMYEGTLQFSDLYALNVDHRILFPNILTLIFARLSQWNQWVDVLFSIGIIGISLLLLYAVYLRQEQHEHAWYIVVPFAFLLFSVSQRENWIWGFQKQIFMVTFAVSVIAWSLDRWVSHWKGFVLSLIFAFIGAWSFLAGNSLWFIVPIVMWFAGYRDWRLYGLWALVAVVNLVLYFSGMPDRDPDSFRRALEGLWFVRYILVFLGGPFSHQQNHLGYGATEIATWSGMIFGIMGAVLLAINVPYYLWVRRISWRQFSPWALLIGYGVANGLLLSIGRAEGLERALIGRYATLAIPFWVGLTAICFSNTAAVLRITTYQLRSYAARSLLVINLMCIGPLMIGYIANFYTAHNAATSRTLIAECFASRLQISPVCLTPGYPAWHPDYVTSNYDFMKARNLSIFGLPQYDDILDFDIRDADIHFVSGEHNAVLRNENINGRNELVLFQHAPSIVRISLYVPTDDGTIMFRSGIYVNTENVESNPDVEQDGALFRLSIVQNDESLPVYEAVFDPNQDKDPVPFEVDLSAYRGQLIQLEFETDPQENTSYDWAMWIYPIIAVVEQASS